METTPTLRQLIGREDSLLLALLCVRVLNALLLQTSYVPDEYWQSLEVAHHSAFGYGYLTWEWRHGLRSFCYPLLFSVMYRILALTGLDYPLLVIKLPCVMQAVLAAFGDWFLYKWVKRLAGKQVAQWSLLLQLCHWYTFYSCTRTLSNSAETSLSTIAFYYYPWNEPFAPGQWRFLVPVALAIVVRPTAAILWSLLCLLHLWYYRHRILTLVKHYLIVGVAILLLAARIDKGFYGQWTNIYLNFFRFNVLHDLASFYGRHPWQWYLTQGLPVLLGPHLLPFAIGCYKARRKLPLALIAWVLAVYSCLGHKEFRFISVVVPLSQYYSGVGMQVLQQRGEPTVRRRVEERLRQRRKEDGTSSEEEDPVLRSSSRCRSPTPRSHVVVLLLLLLTNCLGALYFSLIHQRGTLDATRYILDLSHVGPQRSLARAAPLQPDVLFLMPCHSTPYYSHIHKNISLRFLTCEPNLRRVPRYVDEADRFYRAPLSWLKREYKQRSLPSHIILFSELVPKIREFLSERSFRSCRRYFHTHFPEGRVSEYVDVYCRA